MQRFLRYSGRLTNTKSATKSASPLSTRQLRAHFVPFRWSKGQSRSIVGFSPSRALNDATNYSASTANVGPIVSEYERTKSLPVACPGCGALSQTVDPDAAGFYGASRGTKAKDKRKGKSDQDALFKSVVDSGALGSVELPSDGSSSVSEVPAAAKIPICDRCHYLLHQSKGISIIHPSMHSIRQMIEESPHQHNHIYHILDAADFPMSVIPNLADSLNLPRLRTQNRRSKTSHYTRGRVAEVSFIITRSDLLAPQKEQVDRLVPYLREVLRDALGRSGRNVRLGNVRCVSSRRGWWTKNVKDEIWDRGGAGWMVGKANVGKSALFEVVFPKGRILHQDIDIKSIREKEQRQCGADNLIEDAHQTGLVTEGFSGVATNFKLDGISQAKTDYRDEAAQEEGSQFDSTNSSESMGKGQVASSAILSEPGAPQRMDNTLAHENNTDWKEADGVQQYTEFDEDEDGSLLPPVQLETAYPQMPIVSSLPGTTASPIRIPYGNGRGELIDLPGIDRSSLAQYVQPQFHHDLVMKSRVVPEQYTIKPGQSLLIGGLFRITPLSDDLVFLAYPFVPLEAHVTSIMKAVGIQTGKYPTGETYTGTVQPISTPSARNIMHRAGTFALQWDVTKRRSGPLTDPTAGKQKADKLPFIVYSADLLLEGVGWVELVCQVRKRRNNLAHEQTQSDAFGDLLVEQSRTDTFPEVEVWSPNGKFVGLRRPMDAWALGGPKKIAKRKQRLRPRQTISMQRRREGGARTEM